MENNPNPTPTPTLITAYETLIYETKGAVKMYCCFLSEEQKFFVLLRPWGDQTPPLNYLKLIRSGLELPRNVRAYINDDMGQITKEIASYKVEKPKYIRKNRKKQTS